MSKLLKKSEQTRALVLLEAERLYSAGGYEAINLQTIAKAVGVSKAALFYHFDGKRALFAAMLQRMLERYHQIIETNTGKAHHSSEAQFLALSLALSKQPMFDAFRFLRSELHYLSLGQQKLLQRSCTQLLFNPIKQSFTLALERGEIRQGNVGILSNLFLGFCVLASSMRAMEHGALTTAGHKDMFLMFWHGITPN